MPDGKSTSARDYALSLLRLGHLSIDDEGHIWRRAIITHGRWKPIVPRRAENVGGKGYLRLTLQLPEGRLGSVMAHRVVREWANGPIADDMQVNHKDLDKRNNRLDNLEVVSGSGNIRHSYANGRPHPWHKATVWRGKPRITSEQEAEVRELRDSGLLLREIAVRCGISKTQVACICRKGG